MSGESDVLQSHRDGFIFGQNTPLTSYQSSKTHSTTPDKGQMTNLEVRGENGVGRMGVIRREFPHSSHWSIEASTHIDERNDSRARS